MDITPVMTGNNNLVSSYGDHEVVVNNSALQLPQLLTKDDTIAIEPRALLQLDAGFISKHHELFVKTECLLIGCTNACQMIPTTLKAILAKYNLVVEAMTIGAACRTFNVLVAEDRKVMLILLPD